MQYQPMKDNAWIGVSMDIDIQNQKVVVCIIYKNMS